MERTGLKRVASLESLPQLVDFAAISAEEAGLDMKRVFDVTLAVEEAVVNVFNYAYPHGGGDVELFCSGDGDLFIIEIVDRGIPFDVLSLPDPDTTASIEERSMGGLGIFFIRKLMDEVSYRRDEGKNILKLVLHK